MKNLLKNIEPNLTKEKEGIWNIKKYMNNFGGSHFGVTLCIH